MNQDAAVFVAAGRYACQSVVGGWQTIDQDRDELVGPAFHNIQELWAWQRANLG
jgi:hypothetical protein